MAQNIMLEMTMPEDLASFHLPEGLDHRLHELLDKQDSKEGLTTQEQKEAEGLVSIAEFLTIIKLRAERILKEKESPP